MVIDLPLPAKRSGLCVCCMCLRASVSACVHANTPMRTTCARMHAKLPTPHSLPHARACAQVSVRRLDVVWLLMATAAQAGARQLMRCRHCRELRISTQQAERAERMCVFECVRVCVHACNRPGKQSGCVF